MEMEDEGKLSVPAEIKEWRRVSEGSDPTKHQSKYTKQERAWASFTRLRLPSGFSGKSPRELKTEEVTIV